MSLVEKAYEKFKNSKEQTKVINEKLYFQIIWSDYIDITGRKQGILSIVPSPDMPKLKNAIYQDENGNHSRLPDFILQALPERFRIGILSAVCVVWNGKKQKI